MRVRYTVPSTPPPLAQTTTRSRMSVPRENQGNRLFGWRLDLLSQRAIAVVTQNHAAEQSRRPNATLGVNRHPVGPSIFDPREAPPVVHGAIGGHIICIYALGESVDVVQRPAVGTEAHSVAAFKAAFPDQRDASVRVDSIEIPGIGVGDTIGAGGAASVDRSHKNAAIRIDGQIVESFGQLARIGF